MSRNQGIEKYLMRTTILFDPEMGRRLTYARRLLKMKQTDLARMFGVSQAAISKLEQGKTVTTHINTGRFKAVLGRYFDFVLTGEGSVNVPFYRPLKARSQKNDEF